MKTVIIGSSGHAKVIVDILRQASQDELVGCTTIDATCQDVLGLPVLGDDSILPRLLREGVGQAFVAIGDNRSRARIAQRMEGLGFALINAVHPSAVIAPSVKLGKGIAIMAGAIINPDTVIGDNAIVNTGTTIDHDCVIGANCHLAPGTHVAGNVTIGAGAFLGVGCTVIPKMAIGEWCILGAGATVVMDVPSCVLAVGVPAQVRKKLPQERS